MVVRDTENLTPPSSPPSSLERIIFSLSRYLPNTPLNSANNIMLEHSSIVVSFNNSEHEHNKRDDCLKKNIA